MIHSQDTEVYAHSQAELFIKCALVFVHVFKVAAIGRDEGRGGQDHAVLSRG